jgi:hypothetical protein
MLSLLLLVSLVAAQPAVTAGQDSAGVACTPASVVGTWQFTRPSRSFPGTTALKHVTPTHFVIVRPDAEGRVAAGHGGTYTVTDGVYRETVTYAIGDAPRPLIGQSFSLKCRMDGNVWQVSTGDDDGPAPEHWQRLEAAARP